MTTCKRFYTSLFVTLFLLVAAEYASAQALRLPRPSQKASVMQTIGVTDITITYSRPGVKGRPIWGDPPATMAARAKGEATLDNQNERQKGEPIVPYGHVWRAGANEATQFVTTDDVWINGQKLAAGSYSLHTVPGKDEWTIVFNGTANQWGSFNYDEKKDTLRVKAKPEWVADSQEWLQYSFDPVTDNSAQVNIRWEKIRVPFTVEIKDVAAVALEKARTSVPAAKPTDWQTPFQAARYALQNKSNDDAQRWLDQSLKAVDESIKTKETFQNLSGKAQVLLAAGRKDEALVVAEKAIERGKADKVDTTAFEKRVADIKAGKM
jgi:tetratricopeptide (TPR) repeat protein